MWVTYKFYDEKGRRLTIVGRVVVDQLEIHVVTCSKHDEFSRKAVKTLVNRLSEGVDISDLKFHPVIHLIPIKEDKPKWTFINWCRENFYHRQIATFAFGAYVLCKEDDVLPGIEPCGQLDLIALKRGKVPKIKKNGV
jgi:hypothetical protein